MGRLLEALRAESEPAATPATLATIPATTGTESQSRKSRKGCEPENVTPATATVAESHTLPPDTVAIRARLLMLAQTDGIDSALIRALPETELAAYASVPAHLLAGYLSMLANTADRHAGRAPLADTAAIHCRHCGPVWAHPDIAAALPRVGGWPRALGCPWCAVRKTGGYVPRPSITCGGCQHFTPDTVNPAAGIGTCASNKGTHFPVAAHPCAVFSISIKKGDLA